MPQFPQAGPFNPQDPLTLPQSGIVTPSQGIWLLNMSGQIAAIQSVVNNNIGTNAFLFAAQPSLGVGDVGYVGFVIDLGHLVYWDGAAWQWLEGDRPGKVDLFTADPGAGWALCDGSATSLLAVGGATLVLNAFTTPDLISTPAYLKAAGAYTGTITAKAGTTATGTTGTGTTGTGTSGDESAHTHGPGSYQIDAFQTGVSVGTAIATALDNTIANAVHGTSSAGSAHHHSVPGLSVPGLSVPALGVGSIEMANLGMVPYVRR